MSLSIDMHCDECYESIAWDFRPDGGVDTAAIRDEIEADATENFGWSCYNGHVCPKCKPEE